MQAEQNKRVVIRPQIRGNMKGALVKESGVIRELPIELPDTARILFRIGNVARELAATVLMECGTERAGFAENQARAIEADLALLREVL